MRIGVVSDTHNHLANVARIVELLNRAGVDHVVHTGDITQPKTLDVLARLVAPLTGVLGNNDLGEREGLVAAAGVAAYQYLLIRDRRRENCFRAFQLNNLVGAVIFAGIVAEFLLRIPLFAGAPLAR